MSECKEGELFFLTTRNGMCEVRKKQWRIKDKRGLPGAGKQEIIGFVIVHEVHFTFFFRLVLKSAGKEIMARMAMPWTIMKMSLGTMVLTARPP